MRSRHVLFAIGLLYAGFGVMVALLQGGLPPILRARGLPVDQIAWTFALYLPIGLSFVWAPLVDRFQLPFLSPRIAWIVLAQLLAVGGLVAVAMLENAPMAWLFGLGLMVAVAVATMDLALDAMAVEMTSETLKPLAASLKLAALAAGAMLGGGAMVVALERWGWQTSFLIVAGLLLLSLAPVLGLVPQERQHASSQLRLHSHLHSHLQSHWFACLRQAQMRHYLVALVVCASVIFPLSALNRVMLVDLGVPLDRIAWLVGTLQPMGLLAISLVTTPLIRQLGHQGALVVLGLAGCLCAAALALGWQQSMQMLALAGTLGMSTVVGGLMVVYSALILRWSEGPQAATNYALLFCATRLAGILASVAAGKLVMGIDWQAFYLWGIAALLASSAWLLRSLRKSATIN